MMLHANSMLDQTDKELAVWSMSGSPSPDMYANLAIVAMLALINAVRGLLTLLAD